MGIGPMENDTDYCLKFSLCYSKLKMLNSVLVKKKKLNSESCNFIVACD